MDEIVKHINDTNASFRTPNAGDAKNTDLFLDNEHYELFKEAGDQVTVRFSKENLSKAILFIASILPRKYDNSAMHKSVSYSPEFVYDQLAFLDYYFKEEGVSVARKTQTWNARKDVPKKNGEIDNRFYFNGLLEEVEYVNSNGEHVSSKFTIRNYLAGGYSDLHIKKADDGIFDVWVENVQEPYFDNKDDGMEELDKNSPQGLPLQQIYYGAPGTGKSHGIKKEIKKLTGMDDDENNPYVFRTTFHPDYDYAQFVGCYKPIKDKNDKQKITYEFVPQTFTNAYIKAYQCKSPVVLVIEEINRGNCAQIFGDIFQLLDRDLQGYSEYSIRPDQDLLEYLKEKCPESVNGDRIKLPSNMSILATMNTSDQSLFPMDSAFKRRWDWRYVPIEIGRDKEGKALKWKIVADENEYDWMSFVTEINKRIYKATESEDKQLGFFFCKANTEGVISVDAFTSKVLSYLWTDVFKDSDFDSNMFEDGNGGKITFASLYDNIDNINEQLVAKFIDNVGTKKVGEVDYYYDDENDAETHKTQQTDMNTKTKDFSKYIINGDTNKPLSKRKLVRKAITMFVEKNKELSVERMLEELRKYNVDVAHFVDSEDEYFDRFKDSNDSKQSQRAYLIKWGDDGENKIYVSTQWGAGNIEKFLNKFKVDYIKIEKYN